VLEKVFKIDWIEYSKVKEDHMGAKTELMKNSLRSK
jgi:hypothetical protein